jgi:selenocysteine lyase/cysteine desulfurase
MSNLSDIILRYRQGDSEFRDFQVKKEDILIGRASECDIQLEDQEVSRFHASLRVSADGIWLLDMDSKNGTLIDEQPIAPNRRVALRPEQSFSIGVYSFQTIVSRPGTDATIFKPGAPRLEMYDLEALRANEFPHMLEWTNLDNAAGAPAPGRTVNRMKAVLEQQLATGRWHIGKFPLELLGAFLSGAAAFVNAETPEEIVPVEGCSVGLNLVAQSLGLQPGEAVVLCDLEYPANVYPWMSLERDGVVVRQVPSVSGGLTLESLRAAVDDRTRVVAASAVQFFSGHRTDLQAIGKFCRERELLFVVDAIQAVGHMPIDVRQMNIDVLVTGGHKSLMVAPGAGFMYVRQALCARLKPRSIGALSTAGWLQFLNYDLTPQPGALRFMLGTPNLAWMAGVVESLALINELTRQAIDQHTTRLAARALTAARERGYELTTTPGEHGPIATFKSRLGPDETTALVQLIDQKARVSLARHLDRSGQAHIRMSFHCYNTEAEMERAFDALDGKN